MFTVFVTFLSGALANAANATNEFMQVEGLVLGYYPSLADGVRVMNAKDDGSLTFQPGHRCFKEVRVERTGVADSKVAFAAGDMRDVRNKMSGLIGYPGSAQNRYSDGWDRSAAGLASEYYRDNLIHEPPDDVMHLLFVPMVLSPKPVTVVKTEWTAEAKEILAKDGWPGLERFCGSHFVESVGEEAFVIYSIRIGFPSKIDRERGQSMRLFEGGSQSPALVLNNLYRMNQRFEYSGAGREVALDFLQVGGRQRDVLSLRNELNGLRGFIEEESVPGSSNTRARMTCAPENISSCQKMAQLFLDFQFRRLNFNGERPAFSPVRFRIAPLDYAKTLN